jgi:hypothetical protein
MHRAIAILAAVLLLIGLFPGAAAAARAVRFSDQRTLVVCEPLESEDGTVFAFAEVSRAFGNFGGLAFFEPGTDPFEDQPTIISGDAVVTLSSAGTALDAAYELFVFDPSSDPPFGDPAGTATLDVTLSPIGDPEPIAESIREGNRWVRIAGTRQALVVEGDLALPGGIVYDAAGCNAFSESITVFATDPASFVGRFDQVSLSCQWETEDGFVQLFAESDGFFASSALFVEDASGAYFGSSEALLTSAAYDAAFDLRDAESEEEGPALGSATASATLTGTGERVSFRDHEPFFVSKFFGELLSVDGTLELETPGGQQSLSLDDESCMAVTGRTTFRSVTPAGPKPGPLPNDTPEGALPIRVGSTVRIVTGGLAPAPEAPCTFEFPDEGTVEIPISFTAWWTFTGTGGEVTIDTAGSTFDTVVGIYTRADGGFDQVACVDDVFEPELTRAARVTIDTEAGVTYYIQAGGFAGQTGRLRMSVK